MHHNLYNVSRTPQTPTRSNQRIHDAYDKVSSFLHRNDPKRRDGMGAAKATKRWGKELKSLVAERYANMIEFLAEVYYDEARIPHGTSQREYLEDYEVE